MQILFNLSGKVAVVTGSGSGIGRAISTVFARQGAHVVALDVDEGSAVETVEAIRADGGRADALACDVSDAAQVRTAFEAIDVARHRLDILVNNAGIAHVGNIAETSEEDFDRLYRVNVKGVFLCSQAALPVMRRAGSGVILNLASIAALVGVADRFAYSMSKGAVQAMTKSIAVDYVKQNIRCNCICPARVHTPFVDQFVARHHAGHEKEMMRQLSEYQPMGRMGTAEEVAHLALYLCSDEAAFVTGQAYPIDGGVLNQ
ncbi:MAG: glucose 1-dehydrogenase [Vicinamibacterales bacterium]|nr:glucose 1-dehydrogenase [Vicinamibacterales bacterium]